MAVAAANHGHCLSQNRGLTASSPTRIRLLRQMKGSTLAGSGARVSRLTATAMAKVSRYSYPRLVADQPREVDHPLDLLKELLPVPGIDRAAAVEPVPGVDHEPTHAHAGRLAGVPQHGGVLGLAGIDLTAVPGALGVPEFDAIVSKGGNPANPLVIPQIGEETFEANIQAGHRW